MSRKKQTVTTGYRYYFGMLMGLCRGPVNGIEEIKVGDKRAWVNNSASQNFNLIEDLRVPLRTFTLVYDSDGGGGKGGGSWKRGYTEIAPGTVTTAFIDADGNGAEEQITLGSQVTITVGGATAGVMTVQADGTFTFAGQAGFYGQLPVLRYTAERNGKGTGNRYYAIGGSLADGSTIFIDAYNLFGGEEKEGGIQGSFQVKMGSASQTMTGTLYAAMRNVQLPGMRGVVTAFFDGIVAMNSPYPKPWKFRLWRTTAGWSNNTPWYPAKATVAIPTPPGSVFPLIRAMNAAHIIYECYTNKDWGRGLDPNTIDEASFIQVADQLYAEGFGLCLRWTRKDSIQNFVKGVIEHIGASVFPSRKTGLITIRLVRGGYELDDLPLFTTETGIKEITSSEVSAEGGSVNVVIVKYRDPVTNEDRTVSVGNAAARMAAKGVINSVSKEYPGLPSADLATRVAQRELKALSLSVRRFEMSMDRRGYFIEPGTTIAIENPARGIPRMAVRVAQVDNSNYRDGTVRVVGVQDIFSMPQTSFGANTPPVWTAPNTKPCIGRQRVIEAPYFMLVNTLSEADMAYLSEDVAKIVTFNSVGQPLNAAYDIAVRDSAPTSEDAPISNEYLCS